MARVFISHANTDRQHADGVKRRLEEQGHDVFLSFDPVGGLAVGDDWKRRLSERLRWADAVVCLVTTQYLASRWCFAEVVLAEEHGSRLFPLALEPGVRHEMLIFLQHGEYALDPDATMASLDTQLRRLDGAGGWGWPDGRSPYPGLRHFDTELHRVFFGRQADVKRLTELLRSDRGGDQSAPQSPGQAAAEVLVVVGPSGCGKSSLVRAGLMPALAADDSWLVLPVITPGADPVGAIARELAEMARTLRLGWTIESVRNRLTSPTGLSLLINELLLTASGDGQRRRRALLVVDQFEELTTQSSPVERWQVATLLATAMSRSLGGSLSVVATLRPEFLPVVQADPRLDSLALRPVLIAPLRREMLASVIEGPAHQAGLTVRPILVSRLVAETDSGEGLPLLAFTLEQLAEGLGRGGELTEERYRQMGGVAGALARQASRALETAIAATNRAPHEVIAGLLRLVTVDEQGRPTRRRVRYDELSSTERSEFDAFIARRLLTTEDSDGFTTVGVAHEAFFREWPPLRAAIGAEGAALRKRREVEQVATDWSASGRSKTRLWQAGQLAAALADLRAKPGRLLSRRRVAVEAVTISAEASDFLRASIRRERVRRGRLTTVLSGLLVLALVAVAVAVGFQHSADHQRHVADVQRQMAEQRLRLATARKLITQAQAIQGHDPRTALRLGIAAVSVEPGKETQAALTAILATTRFSAELAGYADWVLSVAYSPDGSILATGTEDHAVQLWDLTGARPRRLGGPLTGHSGAVYAVAFAPKGAFPVLATAGEDTTVRLWDLRDPAHPRPVGDPLRGHTDRILSIAFSPDGKTLATSSADHTVRLWDVSRSDQARPLGKALHCGGAVWSVAFAPRSATMPILATAGSDRTARLWDVTRPDQARLLGLPLRGHIDELRSVAFTPDGRTLATASLDRTVRLWDVTRPTQVTRRGGPLGGHADAIRSVAFSPDGKMMATASADTTVRLWDVSNVDRATAVGEPLVGHTDWVRSVAFAPHGTSLASASDDGTVLLWDTVSDHSRLRRLGNPLTGHQFGVRSLAFSPDGRTLSSGSLDTTVELWDVSEPAAVKRWGDRLGTPQTGNSVGVKSVAFAPDGAWLAAGSLDSSVQVWNVTESELANLTFRQTEPVRSVAFAPDDRVLAVGTGSSVVLWNLNDPAAPAQIGTDLTGHTDNVTAVTFAPKNRKSTTAGLLASASEDKTVRLWDLSDPAQPRPFADPLTGHTGPVWSVAFSPDGNTLATASEDTTVILWDVTNPAKPRRLGIPLIGHTAGVRSVVFAPDGKTLASASDDGTVRLWDVSEPGRPQRLGEPITGFGGAVWSVAFSPDGAILATGGDDAAVLLWDFATFVTGQADLRASAVGRVCTMVGHGLTVEEWTRYDVGLPYISTCAG